MDCLETGNKEEKRARGVQAWGDGSEKVGLDDIGYCMVLGGCAGVQSCPRLAPMSQAVHVVGGGSSLLPGT